MPKVSVVIAALDEERRIEACIKTVMRQTHKDIEVLVADGGSLDATVSIVSRLSQTHGNLHGLNNPGIYPGAGWNECLKRASGRYVLLFSAHAEMPADYVESLVKLFGKKDDGHLAGVGGLYDTDEPSSFDEAIAFEILNNPLSGSAGYKRVRELTMTKTIVFGLYPRKLFDEVGMFDGSLRQGADLEFNLRLGKHGYKLYTDPSIRARYHSNRSVVDMLDLVERYAEAKARLLKRGYINLKVLLAAGYLAGAIALIPLFAVSSIWAEFIFKTYIVALILAGCISYMNTNDIRILISMWLILWLAHIKGSIGTWKGLIA